VGSLAGQPRPGACPYCGRRIGPRFTLGLSSRRSSPARNTWAVHHVPHLGSTVGQLGEDIRYLAGIVGWPAAIWKVTRTAALHALVALGCVLVVALPQTHLVAKAVAGAILATQAGRLLFSLRQARRDATQSRPAQRLASAARHDIPRPGRPPRALDRILRGGQTEADRDQRAGWEAGPAGPEPVLPICPGQPVPGPDRDTLSCRATSSRAGGVAVTGRTSARSGPPDEPGSSDAGDRRRIAGPPAG